MGQESSTNQTSYLRLTHRCTPVKKDPRAKCLSAAAMAPRMRRPPNISVFFVRTRARSVLSIDVCEELTLHSGYGAKLEILGAVPGYTEPGTTRDDESLIGKNLLNGSMSSICAVRDFQSLVPIALTA